MPLISIGLVNDYLQDFKTQATKKQKNKGDYIKLKSFTAEETIE